MSINNVNNEMFKKFNFNIRKIAVGLALSSSIMLSACGNNAESVDKIAEKYITQDQTFDSEEETIIESLSNYEDSYHNYMENKNNVDMRIKLVSETKNLASIAEEVISMKVNNALGTNYDIKLVKTKGDGDYELLGDNSLLSCKIPNDYYKLRNEVQIVRDYQGDGSSTVWDKEINEFNDNGLKLYESILKNISIDYQVNEDNKLVALNSNNITK